MPARGRGRGAAVAIKDTGDRGMHFTGQGGRAMGRGSRGGRIPGGRRGGRGRGGAIRAEEIIQAVNGGEDYKHSRLLVEA